MKRKNIVILSAVSTLGICAVMNLYLIPVIQNSAGGMKIFDMCSFGYGFDEAKLFVSSLSPEGMQTYLHRQLPLDFVYPVVYTVFFVSALLTLCPSKKILIAVPVLLMVSDYTENVLTIRMLTTDFSRSLATFASTVTVVKTLLMVLCFLLLAVFLIRFLNIKRKTAT